MYTQRTYRERETGNRRVSVPEKMQTWACVIIPLLYYGDKNRSEHGPKHQLEAAYFEAPR